MKRQGSFSHGARFLSPNGNGRHQRPQAGVGAVPGKARPGGQEAVGPFQAYPVRLLAFHGLRPGNGCVLLESGEVFESRRLAAAAGDHPPRVCPRCVVGHRHARKTPGEEERGKRGRQPKPSQRALRDACSRAFSRGEQGRQPALPPSEPADRWNDGPALRKKARMKKKQTTDQRWDREDTPLRPQSRKPTAVFF